MESSNTMILEPKIKLLQLRKIMTNPSLIITIDGPLLSKDARRAKFQTKSVANQIQKATKIFNWQSPPRARIAVSFRFLSNQQNPPEIYNLTKYYLDLLQGPVFKEDRQVHYLDASIWRSKTKGKNKPSSLYVQVRRLKDYLQMLDLCGEDEDFNCRDENHVVFYHYIDKNHWDEAKRQCDFLSSSRIMLYDLPRQKTPILSELAQDFNEFHPLVFNFGSLPKWGQSQYFQNVIASSFSELVNNYSIFKHMIVPIEFDVQVTKAGLKLAKDLDNIMITICGEFRKQVLSSNFYVNGYRVYVVDKLESNINSGIQVKILPPGEIESYNEKIRKSLERLEDDLEQRV